MRTTLPDDQGWYWCKDNADNWFMAFVDTGEETIAMWDGHDPIQPPLYFDWDSQQSEQIVAWYGPFNCPGGDFGGLTVIASEDDYKNAEKDRKAIGIQHFDYKYCRDEGHGSSLTISGLYDRKEADGRIHREVGDNVDRSQKLTN